MTVTIVGNATVEQTGYTISHCPSPGWITDKLPRAGFELVTSLIKERTGPASIMPVRERTRECITEIKRKKSGVTENALKHVLDFFPF